MSSPKRLFEKTASKRPRRDSDDKREHSPRQNVERNISTPRAKKPAFNPALLSSAFYSGPTMYGGAGASNSSPYNQYAKSKFYDRKKTDIKVTPSAPDNSMSQTSRRILDLLEQYSSPISDAKRVPINKPPLSHSAKKPFAHRSFLDCTVRSSPEDSSTPSGSRPNRFRELQIPSMATLMKMKRNNCTVSSPQTSITASLSSSLAYRPDSYSIKTSADAGNHKNKIRTKISRRGADRFCDEELPEPVYLPNISLNTPVVDFPKFMLQSFNTPYTNPKQYSPSKIPESAVVGTTRDFKFSSPVHRGTAEPARATRKFFFRDPLDILSSKYGVTSAAEDVSPFTTSNESVSSNSFISIAKNKRVREDTDKDESRGNDELSLRHLSKRPTETWNGNDKTVERSPALVNGDVRKDAVQNYDSPIKGKTHFNNNDEDLLSVNPKTDKAESVGSMDLADFIKSQKSQSWECSTCMTRNNDDKLKCVCCEAAKPGGSRGKSPDTTKPAAISGLADFIKKQSSQWECSSCMTRNDNDKLKCVCCEAIKPGGAAKPPPTDALSVYPGMATFMKKQSAQWECSSCMTRNNDDRIKCVCCEATKPGTEPQKTSANFNFGSPQTVNAFKFGIDQADGGKSLATDTKLASESDKKTNVPDAGFVFGNAAETKVDVPKAGGFTFGIANGGTTITKEPAVPSAGNIFGEKKEAGQPRPVASATPSLPPFTFGLKKPETGSNDAIISSSSSDFKTNTFTFSTPKPTVGSVPPLKNEHEKVESSFGSPLSGSSSLVTAKPLSTTLSSISTSEASASKPVAATFSFGASQSAKPSGGFGGSTRFQFGAAVPSSDATVPSFKPPAVSSTFTFGTKNSTADALTTMKSTESAVSGAEALFRIPPTKSGSLFSTPSSSAPANQDSLKDRIVSNVTSPLQFPSAVQPALEKPKEAVPAFFGFGSPAPDASVPVSGPFKAPAAAAPVFSFGSNAAKSDSGSVAVFGASSTVPAVSLFGAKPQTENKAGSPSTATFKSAVAPSPFASSANLFGSAPSAAAQPAFGASPLGQAASKPATGMFGIAAASQPSLFPGAAPALPAFGSGNIFGSASRTNTVAASPFGAQALGKPAPPESGGPFANSARSSPSGNLFGTSSAAPTPSTGGLFGAATSASAPVFGAAIPFGEAARAPPASNVAFNFGSAGPAMPPTMGFGQSAAPPPVYSFGSQPAPPPSGSQFNFTMGASATGFNPGVNPNGTQRKIKKAVRRTLR